MNENERKQAYDIITATIKHLTDEELKRIIVKIVTKEI